jgi:hypothetical protein
MTLRKPRMRRLKQKQREQVDKGPPPVDTGLPTYKLINTFYFLMKFSLPYKPVKEKNVRA